MEDEEMEIPQEEEAEATEPAAESGGGGPATKPHWRKTQNGKWAICGPQDVMKPGAQVEVFRKDGSSSYQMIGGSQESVGEPFDSHDNPGEKLVYVYDFSEVKDE